MKILKCVSNHSGLSTYFLRRSLHFELTTNHSNLKHLQWFLLPAVPLINSWIYAFRITYLNVSPYTIWKRHLCYFLHESPPLTESPIALCCVYFLRCSLHFDLTISNISMASSSSRSRRFLPKK